MKNKIITVSILLLGMTGCDNQSDDVANQQSQTTTVLQTAKQIATQVSNPTAIKAVARLGDDEYQYTTVFCLDLGSSLATSAVLSNREDSSKPEITVKPPSQSHGANGSVLFDFRKTDVRTIWQLETGKVSKTDNGYTASGMLRGKRMVTQPNGNDKPMPMEDVDLKPFEVDVTC
jgi:hypothetical protein